MAGICACTTKQVENLSSIYTNTHVYIWNNMAVYVISCDDSQICCFSF